jgi:hypothetical protein
VLEMLPMPFVCCCQWRHVVFVWGRLSREVHFMRSFGNGTHDMSAVCCGFRVFFWVVGLGGHVLFEDLIIRKVRKSPSFEPTNRTSTLRTPPCFFFLNRIECPPSFPTVAVPSTAQHFQQQLLISKKWGY